MDAGVSPETWIGLGSLFLNVFQTCFLALLAAGRPHFLEHESTRK